MIVQTIMRNNLYWERTRLFLCLIILMIICSPINAEKKKKNAYEDDEIYLRFVYRSPEQITAFYEGREFPKSAITRITQTCYVTVIIKNKTDDVLWLELDNWIFEKNKQIIKRYKRPYWKKQWEEINLPQAHRSTFGWTLMPDVRDLRPQEGVGGSIPIPKQTGNFSVTFNFATGSDKKGKMKTVKIPETYCKQDVDEE